MPANHQTPVPLKETIGGITYDTDAGRKLAHKPTLSSDQQLFQTPAGQFFLLTLQLHVDGRKLEPNECWIDLRHNPGVSSRLTVSSKITPLTGHEAIRWCVRSLVPETLRGYLLESI